MQRIKGDLDPTMPEEYLEATLRICEQFLEHWEKFSDGDGIPTPDDEVKTKADMFAIIAGCAERGLDALKMKCMVDKIA